jgi:membrane protein DedA with SNARE-associated domain
MITEFLSSTAIHLLTVAGYGGLFILSLIESCGIPVPSEIVLPFAGFLVASHQFALLNATVVATLGNFVGSAILFWIGISGGRWLLERYGKYVLIHRHDIERGDAWFSRHGVKAVFWGRMLPIVRTFVSLPAGVNRMNFKKFSLFTILGALPWNFALIYAGYKAGQNWDSFRPYFHYIDITIAIIVVILVVRHFIKNHHRHA